MEGNGPFIKRYGLNAKNISARDIALCFGVPAQLVGIPDAQTYANVQEARLALYEKTIIPLAEEFSLI